MLIFGVESIEKQLEVFMNRVITYTPINESIVDE